MKNGGFWLVACLVAFAGLPFLTFELVKRVRYSSAPDRLHEALIQCRTRALLQWDDSGMRLADGTPAPTTAFQLDSRSRDDVRMRRRLWDLYASYQTTRQQDHGLSFSIQLTQQRDLFWGKPRVLVLWNVSPHPSIKALLQQALAPFDPDYGAMEY